MPKLSQRAQIKEKADEYAAISKKIEKAEELYQLELGPAIKRFQLATKETSEHHEPKIRKLKEKRALIEEEVIDWLNAHGKAIVLEGKKAIATNETKVGSRVIDPEKFLERAKTKGAAAWDCVNILIAKAEELLGKKTVNEISKKDSKLVASIKLK